MCIQKELTSNVQPVICSLQLDAVDVIVSVSLSPIYDNSSATAHQGFGPT